MKKRDQERKPSTVAVIVLGVFSIVVTTTSAALTSEVCQRPAVVGQVLNAAGDPQGEIGVALERTPTSFENKLMLLGLTSPREINRTATKDDGSFALEASRPGNYHLVLTRPTGAKTYLLLDSVVKDLDLGAIHLTDSKVVEVQVINKGGKPIPRAHLVIGNYSRFLPAELRRMRQAYLKRYSVRDAQHLVDRAGTKRIYGSAWADDTGSALAPAIDGTDVSVWAAAEGFVPGYGSCDNWNCSVVLRDGRPHEIVVQGPNGNAIEGAVVTTNGFPLGLSDRNGRLTVYPLNSRTNYHAEFDSEVLNFNGLSPASTYVNGNAKLTSTIIQLRPKPEIRGRVTHAMTGEPLAGAFIRLSISPSDATYADDEGNFRLATIHIE